MQNVQEVVEREPFRPFSLRLNNGALHQIGSRREVGATLDYGMIFRFTPNGGAVRIDTDSIAEIIEER